MSDDLKAVSRRSFLGQAGAAAVAAGVAAAAAPVAEAQGTVNSPIGKVSSSGRVQQQYTLRVTDAINDALVGIPPHTTNGDEQRYADKSGSYSKGLLQASLGVVDPNAWQSFKQALNSGRQSDWNAVITGGPRTQNGPQGAYRYYLEGADAALFGNAPAPAFQEGLAVVPPAPAVASAAYGTELIENYWGALLRDVAFTDYPTNALANAAAAEMSAQPSYAGPRDGGGNVTPQLLFRGGYPGETAGPYISQFFITPTGLGSQPISQQLQAFTPGVEFMTDEASFQQVQNGIPTGQTLSFDPQNRYGYNGRMLAAYTHVDVLFQAYFTALLVMGAAGMPPNPGSPYVGNRTQNGFSSFGGPDFASTLGAVANIALSSVWYQKWLVHLRHRPESGGGLVQLLLTGRGNQVQAHPAANVLNSQAVQRVFSRFGTYLLPQAFPEGSPTHPAYPTGHGAVAGACITVLKFFFDGNHVIQNPVVPAPDGLSLQPYSGSDAGQITVNGELNKLAHNVSFGHGIHAGIHWRSDTDSSIQLGEAIALSVLQDRAHTYHEPFRIQIQKVDGTYATISNP